MAAHGRLRLLPAAKESRESETLLRLRNNVRPTLATTGSPPNDADKLGLRHRVQVGRCARSTGWLVPTAMNACPPECASTWLWQSMHTKPDASLPPDTGMAMSSVNTTTATPATAARPEARLSDSRTPGRRPQSLRFEIESRSCR